MCGIVGAFAFNSDAQSIDDSLIARLNDMQRRRGPDGSGSWTSENRQIAFGHRRLSIIETGKEGAQPMSDSTGRWVITFNGEIYNYRQLRAELEQLGRRFATNSDTEVLINVVAEWGEVGLRKLRGMFAFALWDKKSKELWLARDAYGIKPLYVATSNGTIWFASQARTLASIAAIDTQRDPAAVVGLYLWGHVPEPFSWWLGIEAFPAGHVQRIREGCVPQARKAYYCIPKAYISHQSEPMASGRLREVLLESVRYHLVADVPVGVFLSGGVDSAAIAALATELNQKLRTITLAFDEYKGTSYDEVPTAESIAKKLKSDHTTIRISRSDFEVLLDDFLNSMDQPTVDGLNTYLVSRAASMQGLKAVLSGIGGDELFGGYPSFRQIPHLIKWDSLIGFLKPSNSKFQKHVTTLVKNLPINPKLIGILKYQGGVANAYRLRRALMLEEELCELLDESWLKKGLARLSTVGAIDKMLEPSHHQAVNVYAQIAILESCWYMRNQLLRDSDWASMASGVELRTPYIDVRVIECLGSAIASKSPPSKADLAACSVFSLKEAIDRPKSGFATPVREWTTNPRSMSARGLRGWVSNIHRHFRNIPHLVY